MIVVASAGWTFVHFIAHFGIFAGYVLAMTRNNKALGGLMRLSWTTKIAGAGFFLFCGVTHISLALRIQDSPVVTATDALQLLSIWVFLISLLIDSRRVVGRLAAAFAAIGEEYDGLAVVHGEEGRRFIQEGKAERLEVGRRVTATIAFALHGDGDTP